MSNAGGPEFVLPPFFDYGATLLWAVSGALLGARRGYDVTGMFILALVSATGGGLLRDGLFLQDGPPVVVQSPDYLLLVLAGTALVVLAGRRVVQLKGFPQLVSLVDALGLGAYAVVGMHRAAGVGLSVPGIVLVGMVNAVGGGVLRAMITGREPHLLRPGSLEAVAVLAGCAVYLSLTRLAHVGDTAAAWITIVLVFVIRALAVKFDIETRALGAFSQDWKQGGPGAATPPSD